MSPNSVADATHRRCVRVARERDRLLPGVVGSTVFSRKRSDVPNPVPFGTRNGRGRYRRRAGQMTVCVDTDALYADRDRDATRRNSSGGVPPSVPPDTSRVPEWDTSASPRLPVSDECSDALVGPRSEEQTGGARRW